MTKNPKLTAEGSDLEPHKVHHSDRRRANAEWKKNRTIGFSRIMGDIDIDDRRIALKTGRNFYELKSHGQTMGWSLNKADIFAAKEAMEHIYIEERADPLGRMQRIEVKPRHITVWEYNPATSMKWRIA